MAKKKDTMPYEELECLKTTFEELDNDKSKLALSLIDEALFLGQTLSVLKQKVKDYGVVTEMCQGKYSIDRENPALRSYNISIKNYQSLIKQITELLPTQNENPKGDGFDDFGADDE